MNPDKKKRSRTAHCYGFLISAILVATAGLSPAGVSLSYGQQAATATLSGRVLDPNQAVVPGARVTAAQKATASARSATTNAEGVFVLTNLPAGDYPVTMR